MRSIVLLLVVFSFCMVIGENDNVGMLRGGRILDDGDGDDDSKRHDGVVHNNNNNTRGEDRKGGGEKRNSTRGIDGLVGHGRNSTRSSRGNSTRSSRGNSTRSSRGNSTRSSRGIRKRGHGLKEVEGSYFVTLDETADEDAFLSVLELACAKIKHKYKKYDRSSDSTTTTTTSYSSSLYETIHRLNVRGLSLEDATQLQEMQGVRVSPDFEVNAEDMESLSLIGASSGRSSSSSISNGGENSIICILDTGILPTHAMFDTDPIGGPSRILAWKDFVKGKIDPYDDSGHGSHVAGTAAGRTGISVGGAPLQGVAPKAGMYIGKVLDKKGFGKWSDIEEGIEWCAGMHDDDMKKEEKDHKIRVDGEENGPVISSPDGSVNINIPPSIPADVINLSIGSGKFITPCHNEEIADVIRAATDAGSLVVSASGNGANENAVSLPACAPDAMSVGATYDANVGPKIYTACQDMQTSIDQIICFSNRWSYLDVVAPGCDIQSASVESDTSINMRCGTSMAVPHVAGLVALIRSAHPNMTPADLRRTIQSTAIDLGEVGRDSVYGFGRIQADTALDNIVSTYPVYNTMPPPPPTPPTFSPIKKPKRQCVKDKEPCKNDKSCCSGRCDKKKLCRRSRQSNKHKDPNSIGPELGKPGKQGRHDGSRNRRNAN